MENNNKFIERPRKAFPAYFNCTMEEEHKKKFTPRLLEKCIAHCISEKKEKLSEH